MKKISIVLSGLFALVLTVTGFQPAHAAAEQVIPTDVTTARSDCVLMELEGSYIADIDAALARMNEIRLEACKEGVESPATGRPLKASDYVPLKWSEDLEYIARIRAAEASLTMDHVRTNGDSCFAICSPSGVRSYSEVIAWNWSESMVPGIEQWYEEKYDWVNDTGNVTGHYTSMIDPNNLYVGLGCFVSEKTNFYNTTAGEFTGDTGLSEKKGSAIEDCLQVLEVSKDAVVGNFSLAGKNKITAGKSADFYATSSVSFKDYWGGNRVTDGLILKDTIFTSSDPSVLTIDDSGKASAISCGEATVSAVTFDGKKLSMKVTVPHKKVEVASLVPAGIGYAGETAATQCSLCGEILTASEKIPAIGKIKLSKTSFTYNGETLKPTVSVTDTNGNIIDKKYYTVSYSSKSSTKVGPYSVTVKFKGNYEGSKKLSYTIKPRNTEVTSLLAGSKSFTLKWKKRTTQVSGYQIRYSTKSSMEDAKTVSIKDNGITSKKVSSLKAKKKYYVQIRTYKLVNDKKYYSAWTAKKSVTTK